MKKRFLFLFVILGLVFVNSCQKEHSLESGNGPSEGTLQDDGSGDCLPKTVNGAYVVGIALVGTVNYIEVTVDVTTVGNFTIYTDTVNGMYFRASGVFTVTGITTVRLKGVGTPAAVGITNFVVNYGTSACTIAVTTAGSLAVFTLDGAPGGCMGALPAGTYTAGTILNSSNTVTITVTVTTAGAYNISTVISNGMTFSGFGTLALGTQTIVLTGAGTPATPGPTNVQVTAGGTSCSFTLNVGGTAAVATYTVKCNTAVPNGTYTQNVALAATNTVTVSVDVAVAGTYSITGTINGMTFSSTAGASFAAAGAGQTVTLNGAGTPTVSGANTVPLTGGTAGCSFVVNVNPAAAPTSVFVANCAGATFAGTYTQNVPLTAANTITLPVNVNTAGTYNSITTTANGMTFTAAAGTFAATGVQNVILTGSGTPLVSGPTTLPISAGTTACNITLNVNLGAAGAAVFTVNCAGAVPNGTYTQNLTLNAANTITLPVNVNTIGTYNTITITANGMTFTKAAGSFAATGIQNITLTGSGTPAASGPTTFNVTAGTIACNIVINVNPGAGGPAVFTVNCSSAVPNGAYVAGTALGATNTITIQVNVATAGTYTITTVAQNGMTFTATGTFAAIGLQTVTLNGSGTPTTGGTFTINTSSGSTPCSFDIDVAYGSWSFVQGATTFSGTFFDAGFDATLLPPYMVFYMAGDNAAAFYFELDLVDVSLTVANAETYNCAVFTGAANTGVFYYEDPAGNTVYEADPSVVPNTMVITVVTHNAAAKRMTGTFTGNVKDAAGATRLITGGTFAITYP